MFDFAVHPDNSPKEFKNICKKIEECFPKADKKKLLVDVDGSTIQVYFVAGKKITVFDDYDIGAVFIESEIAIPIFNGSNQRL